MGLLDELYKQGLLAQPQGVLSEPAPTGLLGALYANPLIQRQVAAQRQTPKAAEWFPAAPKNWTDYAQTLQSNIQQNFPIDSPQAVEQAAYRMAMNIGPLATVFHGSPHLFNKFDMSKVGTGEGAQAYGHGLYFAENPQVAEVYRYVHGGGVPSADAVSYMGREIENLAGVGRAALRSGGAADPGMSAGLLRFPASGADGSIHNFGLGATPAKLMDVLPDFSRPQIDALQALINAKGDGAKAAELLVRRGNQEAAKVAKETAAGFKVTKMAGPDTYKYKVDLPDESIGKMLDWDKPLSQQPESVRKVIQGLKIKNRSGQNMADLDPLGSEIISGLGGQEGASLLLRQAGIPGIKYLDQGSRAGGKGTHNFVVFDDQIPKIVGRE